MCITVNTAKLSKTKIISIPVGNQNHFIAYSNNVKNLSGEPNAMILPIPGKTKKEWFYNTSDYKDFMDEIISKSDLKEDYYGIRSRGVLSKSKSLEFFELGNYKVVLAENFKKLIAFINQLPEKNRPKIKKELSDFFQKEYASCSFVLCMFDSDKTIDAQPIAFEYTPNDFNVLFFPTMDSHDGGAPKKHDLVETDHTFIYEHVGTQKEDMFQKTVKLNSKVPLFLKERKYRFVESKQKNVKNADTLLLLDELSELSFDENPLFYRG